MFQTVFLSFFLITTSLTSFNALAKIYRWVDENGQTQFSDRPVKGQVSDEVKVDTTKNSYGGGDVLNRQRDLLNRYDAQDQQSQKNKQQAGRKKENKERAKAACLRAKDKLASYDRGLLYTLDDQGERIYYSEEKRSKIIASYRELITKNCK